MKYFVGQIFYLQNLNHEMIQVCLQTDKQELMFEILTKNCHAQCGDNVIIFNESHNEWIIKRLKDLLV